MRLVNSIIFYQTLLIYAESAMYMQYNLNNMYVYVIYLIYIMMVSVSQ